MGHRDADSLQLFAGPELVSEGVEQHSRCIHPCWAVLWLPQPHATTPLKVQSCSCMWKNREATPKFWSSWAPLISNCTPSRRKPPGLPWPQAAVATKIPADKKGLTWRPGILPNPNEKALLERQGWLEGASRPAISTRKLYLCTSWDERPVCLPLKAGLKQPNQFHSGNSVWTYKYTSWSSTCTLANTTFPFSHAHVKNLDGFEQSVFREIFHFS